MKIIQKGISNNLIQFNKDKTHITYLMLNKTRRYTNPEEQVQVMAYLSLIFDYGYDPKHIAMFVPVKMGSATREADIIVYHDERHKSPHIVVECKHADASAKAFGEGMKQAFSYAHAIKAKFIWVTSQINNKYFDTSQAHAMDIVACEIPDIPKLGGNVLPYKFTKGGVNGTELQVVTQDELTRIFKYAHDTIWAGGKRNPTQAFDELDKLIFCKLWDETRIMRKLGEPYHFQLYLKEPPDELEKRIKGLYELGRQKSAEVFQDDIRLSAEELQTVVSYLARVNLNDTDLDSKGRAFETFMGSFFRGDFGQYFTPRQIVKFIVDVMPIKNDSLVLDVACGSGGFLLYALDKIRNKADSMVHESYFIRNSHQHRDYWHKFAEHNLYGMEISEMIARVAKMNMIVHDDGHTNVVSVDTLQGMDEVRLITKNNGFENDRFDFILTNPPFGSKIKFEEHRYMEDYELGMKGRNWIDERLKPRAEQVRDSQSSEILFLEQCHNLLKPDGMLAIVMPDG
ncbi:MAG: N-6 DNA methylase, partial [Anaerolineaceae bacterium 4572_78]